MVEEEGLEARALTTAYEELGDTGCCLEVSRFPCNDDSVRNVKTASGGMGLGKCNYMDFRLQRFLRYESSTGKRTPKEAKNVTLSISF